MDQRKASNEFIFEPRARPINGRFLLLGGCWLLKMEREMSQKNGTGAAGSANGVSFGGPDLAADAADAAARTKEIEEAKERTLLLPDVF